MNRTRLFILLLGVGVFFLLVAATAEARLAPAARFGKTNTGTSDNLEYRWGTTIAVKGFESTASVAYRIEVQVDDDATTNTEAVGNWTVGSAPWFHVRASCTDSDAVLSCDTTLNYLKLMLVWDSGSLGETYIANDLNTLTTTDWSYAEVTISNTVAVDGNWRNLGPLCATAGGTCLHPWTAGTGGITNSIMNGAPSNSGLNHIGVFRVVVVAEVNNGGTPQNVRAFNSDTCWYGPSTGTAGFACNHAFYPTRSIGFIQVNPLPVAFEPRDATCSSLDNDAMRGDTVCIHAQFGAPAWINSADLRSLTPTPTTPPAGAAHRVVSCFSETQCWAGVLDTSQRRIGVRLLTLQSDNTLVVGDTHWLLTSTCVSGSCDPTPSNFRLIYFPESGRLVVLYAAHKVVDADLVARYAIAKSVWTWNGASFTNAMPESLILQSTIVSYQALHAERLGSGFALCAGHTTSGTAAGVSCLVYDDPLGAAALTSHFTTDQPYYPNVCTLNTDTFYVTYTFIDATSNRRMKILRFHKPPGGNWAQSGTRTDESASTPAPDLPSDSLGNACFTSASSVYVVSIHNNDPLSRNAPRAGIRRFTSDLGSFVWARPFPLSDVANYPVLKMTNGSIVGLAMDATTGRLKARLWAINGFPLSENMSLSAGTGSTSRLDVIGTLTGANGHKFVIPRGTGSFQVLEVGETPMFQLEVTKAGESPIFATSQLASQATRTSTFVVPPTAALNEYALRLHVEGYSGLAPAPWYPLGYASSAAWPPIRTYEVSGKVDPDGGAYSTAGLFVEEELTVDQCSLDPGNPRPVAHRGEPIGWTCRIRDEWGQPHSSKAIRGALLYEAASGGDAAGAALTLVTDAAGQAVCPRGGCTSIPSGAGGALAAADTYSGGSSQDEVPVQRANRVRLTDAAGGVYGSSGSWGDAAPFFDVDANVYVRGYWQGRDDVDVDRIDFNTGTDDAATADSDFSRVLLHNARGEPTNQFDNLRVTRTHQDPASGAQTGSSTQTLSPSGAGRYRHAWGAWPLWTTAAVSYTLGLIDASGNGPLVVENGASLTKAGGQAHHLRARLDVQDTHLLRGQTQLALATVVDSFQDAADNGIADLSSPPLNAISGTWAHYLDASTTSLYAASFTGQSSPFALTHTLGPTDPLGYRDVLITLAGGPEGRLRGREWVTSPGLYDHHERFTSAPGVTTHWLITNQTDWQRGAASTNADAVTEPGNLRPGSLSPKARWESQSRDLGPASLGPSVGSCRVSTSPGGRVFGWLNASNDNFATELSGGMATYDTLGSGTLSLSLPPARRYYRIELHLEGSATRVEECSLRHAPVSPAGLGDGMGAWRADDLAVAQLVASDSSINLDEDPVLHSATTFAYVQAPGPVRNETYSTTVRLLSPGGAAALVPAYSDTNQVTISNTTRDGRAHARFALTPTAQAGSPWRLETSTVSTPLAQASFSVEPRLANFAWWAHEGSDNVQPWKAARSHLRGEEVRLEASLLNNPEAHQPANVAITDDEGAGLLTSLLPYDPDTGRLRVTWTWPSSTLAEAGTVHRPLVGFTLNGKEHLVQPPEGALLYRNFTIGNLWHAYSPGDTREADSFVVGAHLLWEWADQFNVRGEPYLRQADYTWTHLEPESGIQSQQNPPRDAADPATRSKNRGPEPALNNGSTLPHVRTGLASVPVVAPAGRWTITATAADGVGNTAARTEHVGFLSPVTPWSFQCVSPAQAPRVGDLVNVSCYFTERQQDGTLRYVEPQNPVHIQFFTKRSSEAARSNLTGRMEMSLAAPAADGARSLAYHLQAVPADLELYRSRTLSYRIDTVHNGLPLDAAHDLLLAPDEAPFRLLTTHPLVVEPGVTTTLRVRTVLQDPLLGTVPFGPDSCPLPSCAGDQQGVVRIAIKGFNDTCGCWATYTLPQAAENEGSVLSLLPMDRDLSMAGYSYAWNWTPPGALSGKSFYVIFQATYYGRNVSLVTELVVNTMGGSDPLSLHAPPLVYLDEPFPLLVHAAYLNATARLNAANLLFVTVLDPAGGRLVDAAHPQELGNGAYRLVVTPRTRGAHEAFVTTLDSAGNVQSAALVFRADYDPYRNLTALSEQVHHARVNLTALVEGIGAYLAAQQNASDAQRDHLLGLMQAYLSERANATSHEEQALLLAVRSYILSEANATSAAERALLDGIRSHLIDQNNQTSFTTRSLVEATRTYLAELLNQTSATTQALLLGGQAEARALFNESFEQHASVHALLASVQNELWQETNRTRETILSRLNATSQEERVLLLAIQDWLGGHINASRADLTQTVTSAHGQTRGLVLAVQGYLAANVNETSAAERSLLGVVTADLARHENNSAQLTHELQAFLSNRLNISENQSEASHRDLAQLLASAQDWLARHANATAATARADENSTRQLILAVQSYLANAGNSTSERDTALLLSIQTRLEAQGNASQALLLGVQAFLSGRLNGTEADLVLLLQANHASLTSALANHSEHEEGLLRAIQAWLGERLNVTTSSLGDDLAARYAAQQNLLSAVQSFLSSEVNRTSAAGRAHLLQVETDLHALVNQTSQAERDLLLEAQTVLLQRVADASTEEQRLLLQVHTWLLAHVNQTATRTSSEANASHQLSRDLLLAVQGFLATRVNTTAQDERALLTEVETMLQARLNDTSDAHTRLLQDVQSFLSLRIAEASAAEKGLLLEVQAFLAGQSNASLANLSLRTQESRSATGDLLLAVQHYLLASSNATASNASAHLDATHRTAAALLQSVQDYLARHANTTTGEERALLREAEARLAGRVNDTTASTMLLIEDVQAALTQRLDDTWSAEQMVLASLQSYLASRTNETTAQERALLRDLETNLTARATAHHAQDVELSAAVRTLLLQRLNDTSAEERALVLQVQDWLGTQGNLSREDLTQQMEDARTTTLQILLRVQGYLSDSGNQTSLEERFLVLAIQDYLQRQANATAPLVLATQAYLSSRINATSGESDTLALAGRAYLSDRLNQTRAELGDARGALMSAARFEAWVAGEYRPQTTKENATNGGVQVLVAQLTRADTAESELLAQVVALNGAIGELGRQQNTGLSGVLILQAVLVDLVKYAIIGLAGVIIVTFWARLRHREPRAPLTRIVGKVAAPIDHLARYRTSTLEALKSGFKHPGRRRT